VGHLFQGPLLEVVHKEVRDDRGERGTYSHTISLLVELSTKGEVCGSDDMPK
jgi:hypothetical protein